MELKPIYDIKQIKSSCKLLVWEGWTAALADFLNDSWVVATLHYGVFVGMVSNSTINWLHDPNKEDGKTTGMPDLLSDSFPDALQVVELRIFNGHKEAYFWREGSELKGRLRQDIDGATDFHITDTKLYARGVVSRKLFQLLHTKEGDPVYLTTRNYIGMNAIRQAGYVDCRFVDFKKD